MATEHQSPIVPSIVTEISQESNAPQVAFTRSTDITTKNFSERTVNVSPANSSSNQSTCQSEFAVIWHNLTYKVDTRRWFTKVKEHCFCSSQDVDLQQDGQPTNTRSANQRVILNQICGEARSRQLTAILGPSGAGKSSLLHCLFQNRTTGTSGQILVDGKTKGKLKVCFIPQHDYLNEWLTVREDLIFVSKLKLAPVGGLFRDIAAQSGQESKENDSYVRQVGQGRCTSLIDHEANALHVAELLGIENCLDVRIKNISGGQKKRLSIARELMSKPDILILDEPTTGLDSLTCYKTIMVLKDLAHNSVNSMAVVVTIHQPERSLFNLFDNTYFLSNTGRVIYDDNPKRVVETLSSVARSKLPLANYNPASFLIELASDEKRVDAIDRLAVYQKEKFYEKYSPSHLRSLRGSKSNYSDWKLNSSMRNKSPIERSNISKTEPNMSSSPSQADSEGSAISMSTMNNNQTAEDTSIKMPAQTSTSSEIEVVSPDQYFVSHQLSNCLSSHSNNLLQSFRHVFILTHRSWLSVIRNPTFTKSRLIFHTMLPLMMLVVFGNHMGQVNNCPKLENELNLADMNRNIKNGLIAQNMDETRLGAENTSFYFILMYGFGINIISCTASFYPLTMQMFKKETINGLYSPAPYFIGQMLAELPLEIFFPTISILLSYSLSGQPASFMEWRMFVVAYVVFLVCYSIHSLGLLSGSIFINNVSVAVLLGQICLLPLIMLSGFLTRPTRMGDLMRKLSHISIFKHGLSAFMAARYGFNVCDCDEELIPEIGESVAISGMSPNVKHVIEYMFPKGGNLTQNDIQITEVFEKLGQRFVKAQTFALDIKSCADVKPYLMHVFDVEDTDLFVGVAGLLIIIFVLKLTTFAIMKSFPYRLT